MAFRSVTVGAGRDSKPPGILPAPEPEDELPPGGDETTDARYMAWLDPFVADANLRHLDVCFPARPKKYLFNVFRITGHLFKWLVGWEFPEGTGPTYKHRQRFVAIQYFLRPNQIEDEAKRYVAGIIEAEAKKRK